MDNKLISKTQWIEGIENITQQAKKNLDIINHKNVGYEQYMDVYSEKYARVIYYTKILDNILNQPYVFMSLSRIFAGDSCRRAKDEYMAENNEMMQKAKDRMAIINSNNILLERYMRRMMHPSRLEALKENPDLDVEEYMTRYIESL